MRSRGVFWIVPRAFGNSARRWGGQNGAIEDPRAVRQGMNGIDLVVFSRQSERLRRDLEKPRGFAEVEPWFDSVFGRLVDGNAVMRAQRCDALTRPAIAIACPQSVSVQDAGDEIVIGDQQQLPNDGNDVG